MVPIALIPELDPVFLWVQQSTIDASLLDWLPTLVHDKRKSVLAVDTYAHEPIDGKKTPTVR